MNAVTVHCNLGLVCRTCWLVLLSFMSKPKPKLQNLFKEKERKKETLFWDGANPQKPYACLLNKC